MSYASTDSRGRPIPKVGDLVMFAARCQETAGGMRVEEVDANMFDTRLKVNGRWWVPENFISLEEWKSSCGA